MELTEFTSAALKEILVRPVERSEEARYQEQMARHHYLGALAKIGQTVWYVATWRGQWVAQLSLSAAALKCGVRDRWIGWDFCSQYGRLNLIANNSRLLILPGWNQPNIGSRVLSLTERRADADWRTRFGHPLLLLETFVDPRRFHGAVYRAANWQELGLTQGYRRTREGYSAQAEGPKRIFVRPLCRDTRAQLTHPNRDRFQLTGDSKIMPNAVQMRLLPQCFKSIPDPLAQELKAHCRRQGRRHRLSAVLSIAAGAILQPSLPRLHGSRKTDKLRAVFNVHNSYLGSSTGDDHRIIYRGKMCSSSNARARQPIFTDGSRFSSHCHSGRRHSYFG